MRQVDLEEFLGSLPPSAWQLVLALRGVIRRTVPQAEESLVWGSLSYHRPQVGGRVKGAVCQVVVRRGRVRLDFIHGVRLADPCGLLQGDQVSKRFLSIETVAEARLDDPFDLVHAVQDTRQRVACPPSPRTSATLAA